MTDAEYKCNMAKLHRLAMTIVACRVYDSDPVFKEQVKNEKVNILHDYESFGGLLNEAINRGAADLVGGFAEGGKAGGVDPDAVSGWVYGPEEAK